MPRSTCLQAEDWSAVIDLVKAEGGRYFEQGEASRLLRWMGQVPDDVLLADQGAVLATVALHSMCGSSLAGEALLDRFEGGAGFDDAGAAFAAANRAAWISYHASPDRAEAAATKALALLDGGVTFPDGPFLSVFTPMATRSLAALCLARARAHGASTTVPGIAGGGGPCRWGRRPGSCTPSPRRPGSRSPPGTCRRQWPRPVGPWRQPTRLVWPSTLRWPSPISLSLGSAWSRGTPSGRTRTWSRDGPRTAQQPSQRLVLRMGGAGPRRAHRGPGDRRSGGDRSGPVAEGRPDFFRRWKRGWSPWRPVSTSSPGSRRRRGRVRGPRGARHRRRPRRRAATAAAVGRHRDTCARSWTTGPRSKATRPRPVCRGPVDRGPARSGTATVVGAGRRLRPVVSEAQPRAGSLFLDAGARSPVCLRALYHAAPHPFLRRLCRGRGPGRPGRPDAGRAARRIGN